MNSFRCLAIHTIVSATIVSVNASAQHADFVLFGEASEGGANQAAEDKAVHPITAPFFHEDSFITSDVRAWVIYHDFPKSSLIDGGHAKAAALQLRLALTDEIQFVAYKDGYIDFNTGLIDDSGFFDIGGGIKFNLLHDWETNLHASVGIGYEARTGESEVLQNDDEWRFWGSVNKGLDRLHLGATVNLFLVDDKDGGLGNSDRLSWHLHADYYVNEWFSPVVELNGYHVLDEGNPALPFQGVDVANVGGGEDEEVVTVGLGAEFRVLDNLGLRFAYESPLTSNEDLFGYRWTFSATYAF